MIRINEHMKCLSFFFFFSTLTKTLFSLTQIRCHFSQSTNKMNEFDIMKNGQYSKDIFIKRQKLWLKLYELCSRYRWLCYVWDENCWSRSNLSPAADDKWTPTHILLIFIVQLLQPRQWLRNQSTKPRVIREPRCWPDWAIESLLLPAETHCQHLKPQTPASESPWVCM